MNEKLLGADLSRTLRSIRENRLSDKQFYVSQVAGIGNPSFDHELGYSNLRVPDFGFQLLVFIGSGTLSNTGPPIAT